MNISIFGLGYVGCVSLACLAEMGHRIIGVDIAKSKVDLINQGSPTIYEERITDIISEQHDHKSISATTDYIEAVRETEVSIICVGTPSSTDGHLDLNHIFSSAEQIGNGIREKKEFHTIAIRSTVAPGTNEKVGDIISRYSKKIRNKDFAVVSNPEFLREGCAVKDFYNPPYTILGTDSDDGYHTMCEVYQEINAPIEKVSIQVAEFIKYINNSFHALKICFSNEVGNISKELGIDSYELMDLFVKDTRLNISPAYLKPGFAYGGSCLPKDLKALGTIAHDFYITTPVISAIETSNQNQIEKAFKMVAVKGEKEIGILGLAFKPGTDDLRNSPMVELVERLLGKGYKIRIYDPNINTSLLVGSNRDYIESHIPHLSMLLNFKLQEVIENSSLIIINHALDEFTSLPSKHPNKYFFDFTGMKIRYETNNCEGISW